MASITIKNVDKLLKKLDGISKMPEIEKAMVEATALLQGQAKMLAHPVSNVVAGHIYKATYKEGKKLVGKVYTHITYAGYLEFGTGKKGTGTYPNKKLPLAYRQTPWIYTPDDGETFYRTEGQIAKPFMYPAVRTMEKPIKDRLQKGLHQDIKNNCK